MHLRPAGRASIVTDRSAPKNAIIMGSASRRILVDASCGTRRGPPAIRSKDHYSENPMATRKKQVGRVLIAPRPFVRRPKSSL